MEVPAFQFTASTLLSAVNVPALDFPTPSGFLESSASYLDSYEGYENVEEYEEELLLGEESR